MVRKKRQLVAQAEGARAHARLSYNRGVRRPLALLAVLLLAVSCHRETKVAGEKTPPPVVDDRPQDGGTLIRRIEGDISSLNPALGNTRYERYISHHLFTPLIYYDRNLEPIPGLAEKWEISKDGKLYTFKLHPKATFSDGMPVRASDVVFTLAKLIDPKSEAAQFAGSFELLDLSRTRAIDDHTVEVAFREPLASQLIRFNDLQVMPEHIYSKGSFKNDYNDMAVGSGPYKLVRREAGREIVVERRLDYWGSPRPHIQTVVFKVINDHGTAWNAIKRGEIDETLLTSDTWLREHSNPSLTRTIDFQRFYSRNYNCIAWNARDPLLSDKRLRRALSMSMPMDTIIQDLYHGTARTMTGPFVPEEWAYNPQVQAVRYDPDGAAQLFSSLGWQDKDGDGILEKNGRKLKIDLVLMAGNAQTQQVLQVIQAALKKAGVELELLQLDVSMAIPRIVQGNYQAAYFSWDLDPDPDPYNLFHSTQTPPRGQNVVYYSNPEADRLIEAGRRELDQGKRKEIYQRLHAVLAEDQPYTWAFQSSAKWGINKRIKGVSLSPSQGLYLWMPGEFGWWIPQNQRTHDKKAPAAPATP